MKYIRLVLMISLFMMVFSSGCLKSTAGGNSFVSDRPELQKCNSITDGQNRDNCYKDEAIDMRNEILCEEIVEFANIKVLCYQQVAIAKKDPTLCNKITGDDWRRKLCLKGTES